MSPVKTAFRGYLKLERHTLLIIAAQFCIQAVNTSFFLLLNYYMSKEGYADYQISDVLSYRFFAVCLLAFPLGLYIKGRRLKPLFYVAAIGVPLLSHLILLSIDWRWDQVLNGAIMGWGIAYTCMQVTVLPFILLNTRKDRHSEAFSLSFLSLPVTFFITGAGNYLLHSLRPDIFDEKTVLQIIATLSLFSILFIARVRRSENRSERIPFRKVIYGYDWRTIFRALTPTFIIAVGAGFTIPVISLFFLHIHDVPSEAFSVVGSLTFLLVGVVMFFMPYIRRSFGYRIAITFFQSISIFALLMLGLTEYYNQWEYAVYIAMFFYVVRQPLMSAARPMTSELVMYYVGRRNQEIVSALNASIWAGSWFVSMKIFGWLRQMDFRYVSIFLITVGFYIVGVTWYARLIHLYRRRSGRTGKEPVADTPPLKAESKEKVEV